MATQKHRAMKLRDRKVPQESNWLTGDQGKYPFGPYLAPLSKDGEVIGPIQQSDLLRPLLMDVVHYGLTYAYYKYKKVQPLGKPDPWEQYKYQRTQNPKHLIVVGAGMAGLAAAYELVQVGHTVTILEQQERFGGFSTRYPQPTTIPLLHSPSAGMNLRREEPMMNASEK